MRALEELQDPWAIALAELTAVLAYLFAAPLWQAAAAAALVLVVRVAGGVVLPVAEQPALRPVPPKSVLTHRELEIAVLITRGLTNRQIAEPLGLTERTVESHVHNILGKLNVHSRADIAIWCLQQATRSWFDEPLVRGTLVAGGLVSLTWTIYQIVRTILPRLAGQ